MTPPAFLRTFAPLLLVPVSLALHHTNAVAPVWIFLAGLMAIAVLADWVRRGPARNQAYGPFVEKVVNPWLGLEERCPAPLVGPLPPLTGSLFFNDDGVSGDQLVLIKPAVRNPASAAPLTGASQNNQSWSI